MRLTQGEIRSNAIRFAKEWEDASVERAEAQSFWTDLFAVYGIKRRSVASFEEKVRNLDGHYARIDVFYAGVMLGEHKSRGEDLTKAQSRPSTTSNPSPATAATAKSPSTSSSPISRPSSASTTTLAMPKPLRDAHRAVDRCYRKNPFDSERARVEFLFDLYQKLTAPLTSARKPARKAKPRRKTT